MEHKIVQKAVLAVLNTIYEENFLGFSYGIRPKRSQHGALDALVVGDRQHQGELDSRCRPSDPSSNSVSQEWLVWTLEHRIGDARIIRLIRKWLKAGVLEDGVATVSETRTGQPVCILIGRGLPQQ